MADDWTHFGARLKEFRAQRGVSLQALADASGLTENAIVKIEGGRRGPSWETAIRLADALGVPVESFREPPGEGPRRKPGRPPKAP